MGAGGEQEMSALRVPGRNMNPVVQHSRAVLKSTLNGAGDVGDDHEESVLFGGHG